MIPQTALMIAHIFALLDASIASANFPWAHKESTREEYTIPTTPTGRQHRTVDRIVHR